MSMYFLRRGKVEVLEPKGADVRSFLFTLFFCTRVLFFIFSIALLFCFIYKLLMYRNIFTLICLANHNQCQVLVVLGAGSYFGEIGCLVENGRRLNSVRALTKVEFYSLSKANLDLVRTVGSLMQHFLCPKTQCMCVTVCP